MRGGGKEGKAGGLCTVQVPRSSFCRCAQWRASGDVEKVPEGPEEIGMVLKNDLHLLF